MLSSLTPLSHSKKKLMTKYITVKLTEQQLWELKTEVTNKIVHLQELLLDREYKGWRDEIAFLKRLQATLAIAKS